MDKPAITSPHVDKSAITSPHIDELAITSPHLDEPAIASPYLDEPAMTKKSVNTESVEDEPTVAAEEGAVRQMEIHCKGGQFKVMVGSREGGPARTKPKRKQEKVSGGRVCWMD